MLLPQPALRPYILGLQISESSAAGSYRVLPDTSLVLGFQYRGRLSIIDGGSVMALSPSGVSGLSGTARTFSNAPGTGTLLVYFKPGRATPFFNIPLHELHNLSLGLENLWPPVELRILEERLSTIDDASGRIRLVEEFLLARLRERAPDPLVAEALSRIFASKGQLRIADLARDLHSSASPLEKKFRREVGATAKQFAGLVRFRHILSACAIQPNLTAAAYEAGYFDQAHFIKDFKAFTGENPSAFFA